MDQPNELAVQLVSYLTWTNLLFLVVGITGMWGHALKKFLQGKLTGSIIEYFFKNNLTYSILATMTTLGACLTIILSDQLPDKAGAFILLAFTTGFTADSTINREDTKGKK